MKSKICEACYEENDTQYEFCKNCVNELKAPTPKPENIRQEVELGFKVCPGCTAHNAQEINFCSVCDYRFPRVKSATNRIEDPQNNIRDENIEKQKYCDGCGEFPDDPDSKYCQSCGLQLQFQDQQ